MKIHPRAKKTDDHARDQFFAALDQMPDRDPVRCPSCKKPGFIDQIEVKAHPRTRRLTYSATWAHPSEDGDSESLCGWIFE